MRLTKLFEYYEQILLEGKVEFIVKKQQDAILKRFNFGERNNVKIDIDKDASKYLVKHKLTSTDNDFAIVNVIVSRIQETHHKYTQWLVNRYVKSEFLLEDLPRLKADLKVYDRAKNKLPPNFKDINRFKTLNDFYDVMDLIGESDTRSNKEKDEDLKKELFKSGDAKQIYKDSDITVIMPKTEEAACVLGRGTRWCTSSRDNNMFHHYDNHGELYIIYADKKKYQIHFEAKQFMDERDVEVDPFQFLIDHPTILKAFGKNHKAMWWRFLLQTKNDSSSRDNVFKIYSKLAMIHATDLKSLKVGQFAYRKEQELNMSDVTMIIRSIKRMFKDGEYMPFSKKNLDYIKKHKQASMKELVRFSKDEFKSYGDLYSIKPVNFDVFPFFGIVQSMISLRDHNNLYENDYSNLARYVDKNDITYGKSYNIRVFRDNFKKLSDHLYNMTKTIRELPYYSYNEGGNDNDKFIFKVSKAKRYHGMIASLIESVQYIADYNIESNADKIKKVIADVVEEDFIVSDVDYMEYVWGFNFAQVDIKQLSEFYKKFGADDFAKGKPITPYKLLMKYKLLDV